ncbi:PH domain-containing protein [Romboutsia ilealis]|uniref:PH domain-containing protein n=1 Tax=Romboutsia ilealis TaxID=1115758 RepID=UPI00272AF0C6|nr:PH domain-containing protein [Romboutsia ilealis]
MNLTFKAALMKEWTLLDDRIIHGKKEILLTEIQSIESIIRPTSLKNGIMTIKVNNWPINLVFTPKQKEDGEKAFAYIEENYGSKEDQKTRKISRNIQAEIEDLPCKDAWGTRKEIDELSNILAKDEYIKAMTSGFNDGNTWLIVCTNRRVLMLDKGLLYGLKLIDIPLDRINSISHSKGLMLGKIAITDGSTTRTIENVSNSSVAFFADTVNKEIELYKQSKNTSITQVVNNNSPADELIKYKQLLDMGVLTQEEFDTKKKELLGL